MEVDRHLIQHVRNASYGQDRHDRQIDYMQEPWLNGQLTRDLTVATDG